MSERFSFVMHDGEKSCAAAILECADKFHAGSYVYTDAHWCAVVRSRGLEPPDLFALFSEKGEPAIADKWMSEQMVTHPKMPARIAFFYAVHPANVKRFEQFLVSAVVKMGEPPCSAFLPHVVRQKPTPGPYTTWFTEDVRANGQGRFVDIMAEVMEADDPRWEPWIFQRRGNP
jgi:hypothetical protein